MIQYDSWRDYLADYRLIKQDVYVGMWVKDIQVKIKYKIIYLDDGGVLLESYNKERTFLRSETWEQLIKYFIEVK